MRIYKISNEMSKAKVKALMHEIDELYANGRDEEALTLEEELDPLLEGLDAEDDDLEEDYMGDSDVDQDADNNQGGLDSLIISAYNDYLSSLKGGNVEFNFFDQYEGQRKKDMLVENVWRNLLNAGAKPFGKKVKSTNEFSELTEQEKEHIFNIAKEIYEERMKLISRYKSKNKNEVI